MAIAMFRTKVSAAVLCCTRMNGRFEGEPFTSHYRYIDIYVRRNDAWKIVSVQLTKLPE
jgi:hypothetical protein